MDGVSRRRSSGRAAAAVVASVADVGDVETGVTVAGGEVARGRQTAHWQTSTERREPMHFDVGRSLANDEQFVAE